MKLTNRYLVKKGSLLLAMKLASSLLGLLFYYLLAKQLVAAQFGLFSLAMSCLLFTTAFGKQGLEQASVKLIAISEKNTTARLYWLILAYALFSSLIIALLLMLWAEPLIMFSLKQEKLIQLIPLIAGLTILQTCLAINSSALKGQGHSGSAILFTGFVSTLIANTFMLTNDITSAYQALLLFTCSSLLALLISFVFVGYKLKHRLIIKGELSIAKVKKEFNDVTNISRKLMVISLMALATNQLSLLVLSSNVSLAVLGGYSLAIKLSMLLSYPLIVINAMTAPQYAKLYQANKMIEFKQLALNSTKGLFILATSGVAVIYFSVELVLNFFGESYRESAIIVKILLIGQWVNLSTGSVFSMLIMSGYEKLCRRNTVVITSINIVALLVFIPEYGVIAAAIITSLSMATKNLVSLFYVNKLIYAKAGKTENQP